MRVRLPHHPIGTGSACRRMFRRASSREACDRKIERAPEEMHRAALPDEARSESLEHALALHQRPPEPVDGFRPRTLYACVLLSKGIPSVISFGHAVDA